MAAETPEGGDNSLPIESIKRADTLDALHEGAMDRADLMATLDVSRTTVHRVVRALEGRGLIVQDGSEFRLTPLGRAVAAEVASFRRGVRTASRLEPLLEAVGDDAAAIDVSLFEDATVTTMAPTNPYGPVGRFMELLVASPSLRGFDTTTIAPVFVDNIRDEILGGMEVDVVYLPAVVDAVVDSYPDEVRAAVDSGRLTLSTHPDLPYGLAIFEDRIGVGGYDAETGMLRAFVDTSDPAAREWALAEYERYREEATVLDLSAEE
ncbi:helix-turn-helix transcriptional regulator [Halobacterium wangiae]|uniref:helix-turn-helix transcriptional regulator n=1 Tax=Halobacterium wangiae TaxID=2902623 RepID=UPI001E52B0F6|nr:helix-turn-helix domain-containing protein [Halobacterium wangiae]